MTGGHDDHPGQPGPDEHGSHGSHGSHGEEPLRELDPADLHRAVDDIAATLHAYVDTAAGVRGEFGAAEADVDPRVLALESHVARLNATLYQLIHDRLGMHAELTGMTVDGHDAEGDLEDDGHDHDEDDLDTFHLGFVVTGQAHSPEVTLTSVLGLIDEAGAEIARRLLDQGFTVPEWGSARGGPVLFDEDEDEDDEEPDA
ncbi:hypothetical protein [Actinotalea subterranea]|uniref:hypothetical protein n=1 Tax=Actinotalea subterranea TaxID=2607497 RepID=UPI0011F03C8B|nr:hypothetical protein [Actinotalea subterranea]